jgi:serine/threonine-protein kinase HipA
MANSKTLYLFWDKALVGSIWKEGPAWCLHYESAWISKSKSAISVSLPLQAEPLKGEKVRAFFSNLLPEAAIRTAISQKLGLSEQNAFGLLGALGGDCAGALSVYDSPAPMLTQPRYKSLSKKDLHSLAKNMGKTPLIMAKGLRLSLAGAQQKLPIYESKTGHLYLPEGGAASTIILKPPHPHFDDLVTNEFYCMMLAKI